MTFDPFGDFAQRGYLRNFAGHKDPQLVKEDEHGAFLQNLPEAVEHLRGLERITYQAVLDTHKILFEDVYPWAGQDRTTTAPHQRITKGDIEFALPGYEQKAVEFGLNLAHDQSAMAQKPGEVIGYLAYGHPFLDGNGRTILVVANELAYRAGISIDWASTNKDAYLTALTEEINEPHQGKLDAYLAPHMREAMSPEQTIKVLSGLQGLGPDMGVTSQMSAANEPFTKEEKLQQAVDERMRRDYPAGPPRDNDQDHER